MHPVNIKVEIHCSRPNWVNLPRNAEFREPKYRIYFNNDLLTERSWIWEDSNYIQEDIWVYMGKNINYLIELEPVVKNPAQAKFKITNLSVEDALLIVDESAVNDLGITFKIK